MVARDVRGLYNLIAKKDAPSADTVFAMRLRSATPFLWVPLVFVALWAVRLAAVASWFVRAAASKGYRERGGLARRRSGERPVADVWFSHRRLRDWNEALGEVLESQSNGYYLSAAGVAAESRGKFLEFLEAFRLSEDWALTPAQMEERCADEVLRLCRLQRAHAAFEAVAKTYEDEVRARCVMLHNLGMHPTERRYRAWTDHIRHRGPEHMMKFFFAQVGGAPVPAVLSEEDYAPGAII